jgi:hypothetical protein
VGFRAQIERLLIIALVALLPTRTAQAPDAQGAIIE